MTQFTIHRSALLPALERFGKLVDRRNTIPILANIRLTVEGDSLVLTATDLDIELVASAETMAVRGTFDLTLPSALLSDFVRKLPEAAEIAFDLADGGRVKVSAGRARAQLPSLPSSDYPAGKTAALPHRFDISVLDFARMLSAVQFAISTEETRHYLNGIYLHVVEADGAKLLRAVATDGHRLARSEMPAPDGAEGMASVIVPRKTVAELLRVLKVKDETAQFEVSENLIRLTLADGTSLTSKLVNGTYPDYQRVIPTGNANRFEIKTAPLMSAVERVTIVTADRGRAVKFRFGAEEIELRCANQDTGDIEDAVASAMTSGEAVEIGFNGSYCRDALGVLEGDTVTFALADPGAPAVVTGANPRDLFVLMPMRV